MENQTRTMRNYLITLSDEKGRFKKITKKSKKDEYDIKSDIEMNGIYYVEDIEEIPMDYKEIGVRA